MAPESACTDMPNRDQEPTTTAKPTVVVKPINPTQHDDETIRQTVNRAAARAPLSNFLFDELVAAARRAKL